MAYDYQPTELEDLQSTYSDLYKECYNFRPRFMSAEQWNSTDWLTTQINDLIPTLDRVNQEYLEQQQRDIDYFETLLVKMIAAGCADRAMAIRWLVDVNSDYSDLNRMEWEYGLPFGYLSK